MKRPARKPDGHYYIDGKKYKELFGSREQVVNGTAYKTTGGLTTDDLAMNESTGRIVSAKKQKTAKQEMRLEKYGYFAKKGKFGYVRKSVKKHAAKTKRTKNVKGGAGTCGMGLAASELEEKE